MERIGGHSCSAENTSMNETEFPRDAEFTRGEVREKGLTTVDEDKRKNVKKN